MTIAPLLLVLAAASALATEPAAAQSAVGTPSTTTTSATPPDTDATGGPATAAPRDARPVGRFQPAAQRPAGLPAPTYRAQGPTGFTPAPPPWRTPAPRAHPAQGADCWTHTPGVPPSPRCRVLLEAAFGPRAVGPARTTWEE